MKTEGMTLREAIALLKEQEARIETLEAANATMRAEADRFVAHCNAGAPFGEETLQGRLLVAQGRVVQLCGDLMDFHTLSRHCSRIYDHVSGGRISNPLTYPSEVIREMEEAQTVEFEELYAERLEAERTAEPPTFAALAEANREIRIDRLTAANADRCPEIYHPIDAWSPTDWACSMAGEAGEACNLVKKMRRATEDPREYAWKNRMRIAAEVAHTVIYGDLLCQRIGMSLESAIRREFNHTAARVGSRVRL